MALANPKSNYMEGILNIGNLKLESGETIEQVHIAYERVGAKTGPIILVCHALTGNQYTVGREEEPGWWSNLIGPNQLINTNVFQVITTNVIGGCNGSTGPTTINPSTKKQYRANFPFVTVRDMVQAQYKTLQKLGVKHLHAVIGGSLGGMQVLEWGILYPDFMNHLVPIAVTPYLSDYAISFNSIARYAITQDPLWENGDYSSKKGPDTGLSIARMVGMVTYRSDQLFNQRFSRGLRNEWGREHREQSFEVESYLTYQGEKLTKRFDANSYLYLLKAMDSHDIGRDRGGWRDAAKQIKAKLLAISFKGDLLYPAEELRELTEILEQIGRSSRFAYIDTAFGHDGFLVEFERWGAILKEALYS